jgi:hypothetical protein
MSDLEHAPTLWPSLRESKRKILVEALGRCRGVVLRVEGAVVEYGAGAPKLGLVTEVVACGNGDGDGHLGQ